MTSGDDERALGRHSQSATIGVTTFRIGPRQHSGGPDSQGPTCGPRAPHRETASAILRLTRHAAGTAQCDHVCGAPRLEVLLRMHAGAARSPRGHSALGMQASRPGRLGRRTGQPGRRLRPRRSRAVEPPLMGRARASPRHTPPRERGRGRRAALVGGRRALTLAPTEATGP